LKGTKVELENDIKKVWTEFLTGDWLTEFGNSKALQDLATLTGGTLQTLGGQIDILRNELVTKGIDVSH
jgi:hypothetical protein